MSFPKEVTYQYEQVEVARSSISIKLCNEWLIGMGLTSITSQHFTEDKSIKSTDRQHLKGYLLKWRQARMIIGSTLYTDALKSASLLSLSLENDDIDVVQGIKSILKPHTSLKKLTSQDVVDWPMSKMVLSKLQDENGHKVQYTKDLSYTVSETVPSKLVKSRN